MKQPALIRLFFFILGPLAFVIVYLAIPETFVSPGAHKTLALAAWMIIWWISEAAPIPVTALLPLVLFPFMGIMKMSDAAAPYANHIIFLFMGGFLIAIALEKHRLHERIALNLIKVTGTSGNGIILGFMIATGVISMWISNTATAMMMLPIGTSVIRLLNPRPDSTLYDLAKPQRNFALGVMFAIGYSSSIGGIATLIGSPPNVVFKGLLEETYGLKVSFGDWMLVGVPMAILILASTYIIITRILFPNGIRNVEGSDALLDEKLATLGTISSTEKKVLAVFTLTSLLWIFQELINSVVFKGAGLLNDSNIAMMGGLLMFVVPIDFEKSEFILEWRDTKQLQWGILILFGGGLCLANGLQETGIIHGLWIAQRNEYNWKLILLLIVAGVFLTEVMSNVALVQIFIPVIFGIADGLKADPIMLALPVTLAASMAFMLPISTPPNAIIFSSGYVKMKDMVRAGLLMNIVAILIIFVGSLTLVEWVMGN